MYKDEIAIILQAILNEVEEYVFYKLASDRATSDGSREALMELANDEIKHANCLKKLWKYTTGGGEFSLDTILESGISIPSPEIYKWGNIDKDRIAEAMTVYNIGIQMEKDSITFYENAKLKPLSEPIEKLFDILIKWEHVHLEQFENRHKLLKEEWLDEKEFVPF